MLAIDSSSKNTKKILKQIDLQDYFDTISDGTNIKKSKPDPKDFLKAAEMLGHAPTDCLISSRSSVTFNLRISSEPTVTRC